MDIEIKICVGIAQLVKHSQNRLQDLSSPPAPVYKAGGMVVQALNPNTKETETDRSIT